MLVKWSGMQNPFFTAEDILEDLPTVTNTFMRPKNLIENV